MHQGSNADTASAEAPSRTRQGWLRLLVIGGVVAGLVVLAILAPTAAWMAAIHAWVDAAGWWGGLVFVLVFALWNLLLPPMPLQLVGAACYGLAGGMAVIYLGSSLAIILSWLIGHFLARRAVQAFLHRRPFWRAVDQAIVEEGWRGVVLLRLSNIMPSNLANLACGCSALPLSTVLWASWIGKFPGVLVSVLLGVSGERLLAGDADIGIGTWIGIGVGIVATIVLACLMTRRTRRLLMAEAQQLAKGERSGQA